MNAVFTKEMKKTHTILLPEMLEFHSGLLKAAFEGAGFKFEVLTNSGDLKDKAIKYLNSDYCYPAMLIVGQILDAIESEKYDVGKIAFMEPQTGGACRAGNYYSSIIKVLEKTKHDNIPVISLNINGEEKQPGFTITPRLIKGAVKAVCYGDLLMSLYNQVKPYEINKGDTDLILTEIESILKDEIINGTSFIKRERVRTYHWIYNEFSKIEVSKTYKIKTGITGEIYIKFSKLGNHNLEKFLMTNNCENRVCGFVNYLIYLIDSEVENARICNNSGVYIKACKLIMKIAKSLQNEIYEVSCKYDRFVADTPFEKFKNQCENIIAYNCNIGDGWIVAAEAVDLASKGYKNILIAHPFGCLVSHVCERGIVKKLNERYPDVKFTTIEYDRDVSEGLLQSRIMMGIS